MFLTNLKHVFYLPYSGIIRKKNPTIFTIFFTYTRKFLLFLIKIFLNEIYLIKKFY